MSQFYVNSSSGGGGSGIIETIAGDTGSITGANVTIFSNKASGRNAGSTVTFDNVGSVSTLNLTDTQQNIMLGRLTGSAVVSGNFNVGLGYEASFSSFLGNNNIAIGNGTFSQSVGADNCIAIGQEALRVNEADNLIAIGAFASTSNTTGTQNLSIGVSTLRNNTTGSNNTCVGNGSFENSAVSNNGNTGFGFGVGSNNSGDNNTIMGAAAFTGTGTATQCAFFGFQAGNAVTNGNNNTGFGYAAMNQLTTGVNNIALGHFVGLAYNGNQSNNIVIGSAGDVADSGAIRIGTSGTHTSAFMQGIANTSLANTRSVVIASDGQLASVVTPLNIFTSPVIDFTLTGATPIFTPDLTNDFLITNIIFQALSITGTAAGATVNFGWTATAYSDFATGVVNATTASLTYQPNVIGGTITSPRPLVPSGSSFQVNVTTADGTATTSTGYVIVQGFYV